MIYEDQGDMEKSLQFELIAAHLNPSDTEEWVRLAEMSLEQDNIKQAIFCYTKGNKSVFLISFDKMLYNRFFDQCTCSSGVMLAEIYLFLIFCYTRGRYLGSLYFHVYQQLSLYCELILHKSWLKNRTFSFPPRSVLVLSCSLRVNIRLQ